MNRLRLHERQRPHHHEYTRSLPNSEVNRSRARLVLGWGTAWEDLWVLLAFLPRQPIVALGATCVEDRPASTVAILAQGTHPAHATAGLFVIPDVRIAPADP